MGCERIPWLFESYITHKRNNCIEIQSLQPIHVNPNSKNWKESKSSARGGNVLDMLWTRCVDKSQIIRCIQTKSGVDTHREVYMISHPLKLLFLLTSLLKPSTTFKVSRQPLKQVMAVDIGFLSKRFWDLSLERFEFKIKYYHWKFLSLTPYFMCHALTVQPLTFKPDKRQVLNLQKKNMKESKRRRENQNVNNPFDK